MKSHHVKIPGGQRMLKKIKGSTIYSAFSVGSRASIFGTDADYLEHVVETIIALKDKPDLAILFIAWELQQFNFDQYIVSLDTVSKDSINTCSVLRDKELIDVFKKFESDPLLDRVSDSKEIDTDLAAELFSKMFEPIAKKEGNRVIEYLTPVWEKLKSKIPQDEMKTDVLSLGDVIKKQSEEKDWDNNGKKYNKYLRTLETIQFEYKTQECERREFDSTIEDVFKKRKFVQAGERLKAIFLNPKYSESFKNPAMIKFVNAIINYLNFEAIGKKQIRMYLFTELAQMRSEPPKTFILYPHNPHQNLQKYYKRHNICLITTPMYPITIKEPKPKKAPANEQKNISSQKHTETLPRSSVISSPIIFNKKSENSPSIEAKYSQIDGRSVDKQTISPENHEDFKWEPLEQKRQESNVFSTSHLRQSRHHNLPSLRIPGAFFPPLTPTRASTVGLVIVDLSTVVGMLLQIQSGGAPCSLALAEHKVKEALNQLKNLNSRSEPSEQNSVIYSSPKILAS